MTHFKALVAVAATALCMPVFAMGQNAVQMDSNEDGVLSLAEVQAVYPDMTEENFTIVDLNGDGVLEDVEVKSAQEAGLIPAE